MPFFMAMDGLYPKNEGAIRRVWLWVAYILRMQEPITGCGQGCGMGVQAKTSKQAVIEQ